jgi:uncharacterized protein YbbK (DUF523 family)/uncharacterized protein YbgA (DUF1722 family)
MQNSPDSVHIAVSSCLLGNNVRYDGTNCRNDYINGSLTKYLELVPVCPENLIGLGTPRPPIQLVQSNDGIRSMGVIDRNQDVTSQLQQCAKDFLVQHPAVSGLILKSKSPSCGVNTSKLYDHYGQLIHQHATGIFAAVILADVTRIPVTGEDRLELTQDRLEFFTRVYAISRLKMAMKSVEPTNAVITFHQRYLPLIKIISPAAAYRLDNYVLSTFQYQDQIPCLNTYYDDFSQIISAKISRDTYRQYLQLYVAKHFRLSDKKVMEITMENYATGRIEWPDLISQIDAAIINSDNQCQRITDSLFPLSILA